MDQQFVKAEGDFSKCWGDLSKFLFEKTIKSGVDFHRALHISQILRYTAVATAISEIQKDKISILDVGCSTATFYGFFKENFNRNGKTHAYEYHGLEVYKKLLNLAKTSYGENSNFKASFFDGNLTSIAELQNEADVVLMQQFIEHIDKNCAMQQLDAAYDILSDDGLLVISAPNPDKKNGQSFVFPDHHEYEYSLDEITSILNEKKFTIIKQFGWIGMGNLKFDALSAEEQRLHQALSGISSGIADAVLAHLNTEFSPYYLLIAKKIK